MSDSNREWGENTDEAIRRRISATRKMQVTQSVKITLPLPPSVLHAHNKGHWRVKAPAIKAARYEAMWSTIANNPRDLRFERAILSLTFFVPDNRQRDALNLTQSMKPSIDGVVASKLIPGDHWQVLKIGDIDCEIDRKKPRVVLVFQELVEGES